jgi:hypothetical protein
MTPTGYEVMIDGQWTPVPWQRVLWRTDNPTGEAYGSWDDHFLLCSPARHMKT